MKNDKVKDTYLCRVKATGEELICYKLHGGNFYDYENMSEALPPSAPKAGKKEFKMEYQSATGGYDGELEIIQKY